MDLLGAPFGGIAAIGLGAVHSSIPKSLKFTTISNVTPTIHCRERGDVIDPPTQKEESLLSLANFERSSL